MAAVVAEELRPEPVRHQPGVAVRAAEMVAAGAAKGQRRLAMITAYDAPTARWGVAAGADLLYALSAEALAG